MQPFRQLPKLTYHLTQEVQRLSRELEAKETLISHLRVVIVLVLAFTPHASVKLTTLKNAGNSCSLAKRLSCLAGHMVRHVFCHMVRHVLCHMVCHVLCHMIGSMFRHMIGSMFRHLTMTHHLWWLVMWLALIFLIYQPHFWLAAAHSFDSALPSHTSGWLFLSLSSATLLVGCSYLYRLPHFWLVVLIFIVCHTSGWLFLSLSSATLLVGCHTFL